VSQRPHPFLLGLAIAVMMLGWTFNFVIAKAGLAELQPMTLASFRVVTAAAIMSAVYGVYRLRQPAAERAPQRFTRGDLWIFAQLGLLGVAMNQVLFTVGLNYTTVGHSSLIIGTGPITILLLAWFQGLEKLTVKKLLGMSISFGGVALLAAEHGISLERGTLRGDLITLAGSLAFALYAVLAKPVTRKYHPITMNFFNYLTGAIVILPLAIRQAGAQDWSRVSWAGWGTILYMAGIASVLAYLLFYWVLTHLSAARLAAFTYLQPVLVTVLGVILLEEGITKQFLASGALILAGVYLTELGPRENGANSKDGPEE
jgi:drug/metabolite transporter (DMT)-like permease